MQRLDKFLSEAGAASRKEIRQLVRQGRITVNGAAATAPDMKVDETAAEVRLDGEPVAGRRT